MQCLALRGTCRAQLGEGRGELRRTRRTRAHAKHLLRIRRPLRELDVAFADGKRLRQQRADRLRSLRRAARGGGRGLRAPFSASILEP